jgi:predicted transcriptional regulator YdeE
VEPKFNIIEMPKRILIGLDADFYGAMSPKFNGQEKLAPVWGAMYQKKNEFGFGPKVLMIGATRAAEGATDGLLNQFVGLVVEELPADLRGLNILELPGGTYATFEHIGGMETLVKSTQEFYNELLPDMGCTVDNGLHLEIYDERFDLNRADSIMLIAAPIK